MRSVTAASPASSSRSTIGMSWIWRAPSWSRKNRYTSSGWPSLAACTVHRTFQSTWCALRQVEATDHLVESRFALLVDPVGVVELARPVDADPDEESVLDEQPAELVGEQGAVGLDGVDQSLVRTAVALAGLERTAEELDAHERGLASLPRHRDLGVGVRLEQLSHVRVEYLVGHSEPVTGVQRLLLQEEAVLAVEVADGTARLGQHMEIRRRRRGAQGGHRGHHRLRRRCSPVSTRPDEGHGCVFGHGRSYVCVRRTPLSAGPSRSRTRRAPAPVIHVALPETSITLSMVIRRLHSGATHRRRTQSSGR